MSICDLDAERAVLGAILLSDRALPALIVDEGLAPEHFHRDRHRKLYAAMLALHDASEPVDSLTLARKTGLDRADIDSLAADTPDAGNVRHHARLVKDAAERRRWQTAAQLLLDAERQIDPAKARELVAQAERELTAPTVTDDTHDPERLASEVFDYLGDTRPTGITTGFLELDDILGGGLRPGDTTVLAGWESSGKSAAVLGWLTGAARDGLRVHSYINEMSTADIALRMLAHLGAAPWQRLARRSLRDADTQRITAALSAGLPFGVTDCSMWSAEQIARHIRVNRWDLCALDVLHNIPYQRESELHQIVATLAAGARSVGSHLVLVCHLNQERAKDETLPRPVLRDLRGSGMISKIAASVLFLHREQHKTSEGFIETAMEGVLVAEKARHGRRGDGVEVVFEPQRMRFRAATPADRWETAA